MVTSETPEAERSVGIIGVSLVLMAKLSRTFLGECIPKISADSPVSPSHFATPGTLD